MGLFRKDLQAVLHRSIREGSADCAAYSVKAVSAGCSAHPVRSVFVTLQAVPVPVIVPRALCFDGGMPASCHGFRL